MLKFLNKKDNKNNKDQDLLIKTASLFIHAAKIDQNYSEKEKEIIKKALIKLGANQDIIEEILIKAESYEENSNQILDFTREIKNNADENFKVELVETLWSIIYSDKESDMYEANLMRRLSGLLYLDNKIVGDIKEKIKKSLNT